MDERDRSMKNANEFKLSKGAERAMNSLLIGERTYAGEAVIQELGRAGLAYRVNWKSNRIALTEVGMKCVREK